MTKNAVIQMFFSGYGLQAYPDTSVPTGSNAPSFPYVTYNASTDSDMGRTTVTASVWYRSMNWTEINAKIDEISADIGTAKTIECENGAIIVRKGTPFAQPLGDNNDDMVKRKVLMFDFLFATTY